MAERRGYVIGVSPHKTGGYRVKYVEDGKQRVKYRKRERAANDLAARLQIELEGLADLTPRQDKAPSGSGLASGEWARVLWGLAARVVTDQADENAQRAARAVAGCANAAAKFIDYEAVIRRLEHLERRADSEKKDRPAGDAKRRKPTDTPGKA